MNVYWIHSVKMDISGDWDLFEIRLLEEKVISKQTVAEAEMQD